MKVVLSKAWHKSIRGLFLLEVIGILSSCVWFREDMVLIIIMCLFVLVGCTIAQIIMLGCGYRFLTYVIDTTDYYKSYLFKKELCVINKREKIYYAIFFAQESMVTRKRFIVISNEPFKYEERGAIRIFPWDKKPLLVSYDVRTQIAMPYDEQTKELLKVERWICVN